MYCVRKAVPTDALGIAIVNVYTWKTAYHGLVPEEIIDERVGQLQERAKQCRKGIVSDDNVLVATVEHTIVGFCIYTHSRCKDYSDAGEIVALYVLEGFHGLGIGKSLFLSAVRELRKLNYKTMFLECVRNNPSLEFYEHMGGKVVDECKEKIMGHTIVMNVVYYNDLHLLIENHAKELGKLG